MRRLIYSQLPLPLGTLPLNSIAANRRNGEDKALDDAETGSDHGCPVGAFMGEAPRPSQPTALVKEAFAPPNCHSQEPVTQAGP